MLEWSRKLLTRFWKVSASSSQPARKGNLHAELMLFVALAVEWGEGWCCCCWRRRGQGRRR